MTPRAALTRGTTRGNAPGDTTEYCVRQGLLKLLAVKDSDVRLLSLEQCRDAVDKSLHAGGAFSATIPLVSLYYGGFIQYDAVDPTRPGQDLFVLSKGHAVAALPRVDGGEHARAGRGGVRHADRDRGIRGPAGVVAERRRRRGRHDPIRSVCVG